jgi:hypothetical protein
MAAPLLALIALIGLIAARRRRRHHLPARTVIVSPQESTVIARDGAVRSLQSAVLTTDAGTLDRLWTATNLENLGRTYWLFLSKMTLGFIRIIYSENARSVVFINRPLTLLRFETPEYLIEPDHGQITWRIRDGLLVARAGRGCGFLSLDVRREGPTTVRIEVEVANFYPAIAAGFSVLVYEMTQSAIHVVVTHAFLRSLAKLELAKSQVGLLRALDAPADLAPTAPADPAPTASADPGQP